MTLLKDGTLLALVQLSKMNAEVSKQQLALFLGTSNNQLQRVLRQLVRRALVRVEDECVMLLPAGQKRVACIQWRYQTWISLEQQVPETGLMSGALLQLAGTHLW